MSSREPEIGDNADELRFAIDANLDGFGHAVRLIGERMDQWNVTERARYIVDLALDEMLTNIVRYAYTDGNPPKEHAIDLVLRRSGDDLLLTLEDDGRPFDPTTATPKPMSTSLEEATIGGRGIAMVRKMAKAMHYERRNHRNILTITVANA